MSPADELRLFVAIELPNDVLSALEASQALLRSKGLGALRWVRPEGIHLTLKFLGETPPSRVEEISSAVKAATSGHAPHSLLLGRLGTFGGRYNPRVLWVDVGGDVETTTALQRSIDDALAAMGFAKETRVFSPHLTLARVRPETARDVAGVLAEALDSTSPPVGEIDVRKLSLMQSTLGSGGAVYRQVEAFPLEA